MKHGFLAHITYMQLQRDAYDKDCIRVCEAAQCCLP